MIRQQTKAWPGLLFMLWSLVLSESLCTVSWAAVNWNVDLSSSYIHFAASQSGHPFTGSFKSFLADIQFDQNDLQRSRFDVTIDLVSVDSEDEERDSAIRGPELLAARLYPQAHYIATRFDRLANGRFEAHGLLTLKNVTREVPVLFKALHDDCSALLLDGETTVNCLDFGVGDKAYISSDPAANEVKVHFSLRMHKR
jgi:polyisoprenoid-binding protein YceI